MKRTTSFFKRAVICPALLIALLLSSCGTDNTGAAEAASTQPAVPNTTEAAGTATQNSEDENISKIEIIIGENVFFANLYNNAASADFLSLLPMTAEMNELNGNEKYYYLNDTLSVDAQKPDFIRTGDLMLYGYNCLVLFYKDFRTSHSYTPLGRIENPQGLETALGNGNAEVTFRLAES